MAQVNYLECSGDSHFSGPINKMEGTLFVSGGRVYSLTDIYPVGSVYMSTDSSIANYPIYGIGTWYKMGSFTIGSYTIYAYKRTA